MLVDVYKRQHRLTQMKFRFFTNVSHDLRTPLTLIITPLSSLLSEIQDGKLKQQLSSIYRNAEELLQLVNQLLDFRKLEVSEEKLNLTNADIREFVTTTCEAFESYANNKQIHFSVIPLKQTLYMYLDRDKVHRILYNLLNNAFKFTPPEGRIDVFFKMENRGGIQYVCIIVQNTGQEIAADELPHIFDRYRCV